MDAALRTLCTMVAGMLHHAYWGPRVRRGMAQRAAFASCRAQGAALKIPVVSMLRSHTKESGGSARLH